MTMSTAIGLGPFSQIARMVGYRRGASGLPSSLFLRRGNCLERQPKCHRLNFPRGVAIGTVFAWRPVNARIRRHQTKDGNVLLIGEASEGENTACGYKKDVDCRRVHTDDEITLDRSPLHASTSDGRHPRGASRQSSPEGCETYSRIGLKRCSAVVADTPAGYDGPLRRLSIGAEGDDLAPLRRGFFMCPRLAAASGKSSHA